MNCRNSMLYVVLFMGLTIGSLNAQERLSRSSLDTPRESLRQAIQNARNELQSTLEKLNGELMRIAVAADRQRINTFVIRMKPQIESAITRLDAMQARLGDPATDPVLMRTEFDGTTRLLLQDIRVFERTIRQRIMTSAQVSRAVRVTDQALVRAAQSTQKAADGEASFGGLRRSFELQEDARQAQTLGKLELAMRLTLKARDLLGETLSAVVDSVDMQLVKERVAGYYRETVTQLEKTRTLTTAQQNPRVANRLDQVEKMVEQARDFARERPYVAMRLLQESRDILGSITRRDDHADNISDRLDRFALKLSESKTMLVGSPNQRAVQIVEKAEAHFRKAREFHQNNQDNRAIAQLDIAMKLAARAAELGRGDGAAVQSLNKEIAKTGMIVRRAETVAVTDEQKELVRQAHAQLNEAQSRQDNPSVCLNLLDGATSAAFKVIAQSRESDTKD